MTTAQIINELKRVRRLLHFGYDELSEVDIALGRLVEALEEDRRAQGAKQKKKG